jgi:hypothetical protein
VDDDPHLELPPRSFKKLNTVHTARIGGREAGTNPFGALLRHRKDRNV